MEKRILKILTVVFLIAITISISVIPAFADSPVITANLTVEKVTNYVGDDVNFNVRIVTESIYIKKIEISQTRGGVIASKSVGLFFAEGESIDIPVKKVFTSAGDFGQTFIVNCVWGEYSDTLTTETVTTNTVSVNIINPPTPTPKPTIEPTPTPEPTTEPTPVPTLEPTQTPATTTTPNETANADDEMKDTEQPANKADVQTIDVESNGESNNTLVIALFVVGALLLLFVIGFAVVLTLLIVRRKL